MRTDDFDYLLPDESIAQSAIEPRHDSRLLITSDRSEVRFLNLDSVLVAGDLLVVNRTRVRAARLIGSRVPTGGACELLLTKRIDDVRWQALIKGSKRMHPGSVIQCGTIHAVVMTEPEHGVVTVELASSADIEQAIQAEGRIPLPPYFHGRLSIDDRYQTMFASVVGSAAAPTAALHFTPEVIANLEEASVEIAEVELQVGLDTFRPMGEGAIEDHQMHHERIVVDASAVAAIHRTRSRGGRVIAVGTTVARTLESVQAGSGEITATQEIVETGLFIRPGYRFGVIDGLITNFHAPRTSLLVMIAAIVGSDWKDLYEHALAHRFRFLSFGDAMYMEVKR